MKKNVFKWSLIYSLIYVGLGTLALLMEAPGSPVATGLAAPIILLTFPVTIVSFGILYVETDVLDKVLLVQLVTFFVFWALVYLVMRLWSRKNSK